MKTRIPIRKTTAASDGFNGRSASGKFSKGNRFGLGSASKLQKRTAMYRSVIFECVTPKRLYAVILSMIERAKRGDVAAAKLILDRVCGRTEVDILQTMTKQQPSTYDADERFL